MATIDDYAERPEQALIDAVTDPGIRQYITPEDIEVLTVTQTDGTQAQVQALSRKGAQAVVRRIIARAQALQVDLSHWICSPDEFNWCAKLRTPVGARMRQLDAFLQNKFIQGGVNAAGLVTLFTLPAVGAALTVFSALGFINGIFVELCHCPHPA
jgi:hypothetical protein